MNIQIVITGFGSKICDSTDDTSNQIYEVFSGDEIPEAIKFLETLIQSE